MIALGLEDYFPLQHLKLNLGCGLDVRPGYVNVDFAPREGVVAYDLEKTPWPWPDESVDEILALNVLEHVNRFDAVWHEIHRILRPGGRITIEVTYRHSADPFHHSIWDRRSIRFLLNGYATSASPKHAFRRVGRPRFRHIPSGFPWWHVHTYLKFDLPPIPGTQLHMSFTLERL